MGNTITAEAARKITGKHWMTRREAAKYLGLAEQTLANSRAKGPKYYKFLRYGSIPAEGLGYVGISACGGSMSAGAMEGLAAGASTPDLDSSAQLALDAIVTLTNGGYGRAAMRAIATEAGLSVPTVSKAVKRLETMGLLVAQRPAGAGRSTVYEVAENARSNYTRRGPVSEASTRLLSIP